MSRSASEPRVVLIGVPGGERARALQESLRHNGYRPAAEISYRDVLAGRPVIAGQVRAGDVVRLDSPSDDPALDAALVRLGGGQPLDPADGGLLPSRDWHRGLRILLAEVDSQLAGAPAHRRLQHTGSVLAMFDKVATRRRMDAAGVPGPAWFGLPGDGGAAAVDAVRATGLRQVMVKPRYGSSAAGMVALRTSGNRVRAWTTVRFDRGRACNSRSPVRLDDWAAVRQVLDVTAPQGLLAERWIPKAGFDCGSVDLRVVTIGGRACQVLARVARGPFTNLHLGSRRGDVVRLREAMGQASWNRVLDTAERAAAAFPDALYAGVDVLVAQGSWAPACLEVNAFGDFHEGVEHEGLDTYAAELAALQREPAA